MLATLTAIFFIFGLIIGSFLNVVILRYNTARTFGGRSACMSCQNTLSWHELIPLFSFVILGGRCKNCQTKISWQYPAVELLTGVIFSLLIVVAVYDLKHKIIPDMLAFIFGILAFLGLFFFTSYGFYPHLPGLWDFLAGPLIAFPFAAIWFLSRGTWMGLGDAKLAVGLGWLLGLSRGLSGVVVAFWSGAVLGALLIALTKKYGMKSEIPFAPFLVLGAVIAFLFELHLFPIF